jgi:hypothetical protein
MPRRAAISCVPVLLASFTILASCGGGSQSSADAGVGEDGTTGGADGLGGEDGTTGDAAGTSSGASGSSGGSSGGSSSSGSSSGGSSSSGSSSGGGSSDGGSADGGSADASRSDASGSDGGSSSGGSSSSSSGSSSNSSSSGGSDASTSDGAAPPDAGSGAYDPSVYQHHKNGTRNGLYVDPVLTSGATGHAATMHVLSGFMGIVTTNVYAQPLYVANGPGGNEAFIVATESNHLTVFNAGTGAVLWDQGPSTYAPYATGGLSCPGDVNPLGITGTPFIDPASPINAGQGVIYFAAMTTPDNNTTLKHMVYAVKLSDGTVLPNWPVDVAAKLTSFTSKAQNQRGALQLVNGVLYVPYGGLDGDCGPYFGWVVGFPVTNPQSPTAWHTAAPQGGIWGPGALPTDGTSIFPITGNTARGTTTWGGGEAVIRLGAGPTFSGNSADYYAPSNWQSLDTGDTDLGGASEVLFDMPGTSTPHLVAAGGKDGHIYLLNRDNLGGIGGELFNQQMATNQFKGAPIAYTTTKGTYVAFHVEGGSGMGCPSGQTGNLASYKITGGAGKPTASIAWCSTQNNLGSPIVTTIDGTSNPIVWNANNHLWAYDGDTGASLFTGTNTAMGSSVQGWNTPIAVGGGRIAVAVNGQLYLFSAP